MPTVRLLLVRHGASIWNETEHIQGQQDVPLSDAGRRHAEALGQRLRGEPLAACFSSPLQRAIETARIVQQTAGTAVPIVPLPELMERHFGTWEGKRVAELNQDALSRWVAAFLLPAPPDGESLEQLFERVRQGIERILTETPSGTALVVGHSGSVKAALCVLLRLPLTSFARLRVDNGSLTVVEVRNGRSELVTFNDTCHLTVG
ncbi:Phosphoserine phosphatase 1 [bacterium HR17]|jgi:broad specificity phosphatase PhoE|uniref:Phosphoserine phosphatase 1 n=1 Tax=Candidatus Fervidibacter japonicus TaxID=2035412 RepID=A0A2H5X9U2_9BACT|nr:Phosphoserine phosphatase 1 [bacterium HR17]